MFKAEVDNIILPSEGRALEQIHRENTGFAAR